MERLHILRGNCRKDPEGYYDEFQNQYVGYKSFLETVRAQPASASEDFKELVEFISYLSDKYKELTKEFAKDIVGLLETYNEQLEASTRRCLVQALIVVKRKQQVDSMTILPLFFKLFNVRDKELRKMLQGFIVADVKHNTKQGADRHLQGFLFKQVDEGQERVAKRGLAIVIELWRTYVWRNPRTVSVIAHAVQNPSHQIMLAALKFFLGQDQKLSEDDDDEESDLEADSNKAISMSIPNSQFYNAKTKGTLAGKKKKKIKMERAVKSIKKAVRKDKENQLESFAAIQLINDPQEFAEKLFARLNRERSIKFDTKIAMMKVISRSIGVHKLMLINFYPQIQKYLNPSQKDVTQVLAALVQACHEVVPPDVLQPVLRQLVDSFVHDRARPEVMTIGLKTVRQICERCPLIMNEDLLQDLTQYQKFKNKEVTSAARGLIGLFRQLAPSMLSRKDRGRAANIDAKPLEYGVFTSKTRVEGAELLERAMQQGVLDEDGNIEGELQSDDDDAEEGKEETLSEDEEQEGEIDVENDQDDEESLEQTGDEADSDEDEEIEEDNENEIIDEENQETDTNQLEHENQSENSEHESEENQDNNDDNNNSENQSDADLIIHKNKKPRLESNPDSLTSLRRELANKLRTKNNDDQQDNQINNENQILIEQTKFISQDEFDAIKELRRSQLIREALRKHGLMTVSKKRKLEEEAEMYADAVMGLEKRRATIGETIIKEDDIKGQHKGRASKEERIESILKGREDRPEYGARAQRRKTKSNASLSNKQKERKKLLPLGAKKNQIKRRQKKKALRGRKNFKGKVKK